MNSFSYTYEVLSQAVVRITPDIFVDDPAVELSGSVSYFLGATLLGSDAQDTPFEYDFSGAGVYEVTCEYQSLNVADSQTLEVTVNPFTPSLALPPVAIQVVNRPFTVTPVSLDLSGASDGELRWQWVDKNGVVVNEQNLTVTNAASAAYTYTPLTFGRFKLKAHLVTDSGTYDTEVTIQVSEVWAIRKVNNDWLVYNFSTTPLTVQIYNSSGTLNTSVIVAGQTTLTITLDPGSYKIIVNSQQAIIHNYPTLAANMRQLLLDLICKVVGACGCATGLEYCTYAIAFHIYRLIFFKIRYEAQIVDANFNDFANLYDTEKQAKTLDSYLTQLLAK